MQVQYLVKRERRYYFRRVVPQELRSSFDKNQIMISLKTSDEGVALKKYAEQNALVEAMFASLLDDGASSAQPTFQEVVKLSADLGFHYQPIDPSGSLEETVNSLSPRLGILKTIKSPSKTQVAAIAGAIKPTLTLAQAYERYIDLTTDNWMNLSAREREKKHRPIAEAVADFTKTMGNRDLLALTKADVYDYRKTLIARVGTKDIRVGTANKKMMHLRKLMTKIFEVDHPHLVNPFIGVKINGPKLDGTRPPFDETDIIALRKHMDNSDSNDELKSIIYVAMFTGAGPKELAFLTPEDIFLDAQIPYIKIGPNAHRHVVKGGGKRHRDIPLVGDALTWLKKFPSGFPRYRRDNGGESLSAAANKLIKGCCSGTFYSFRHRIADLLRNAGISDSLKDEIMGHATRGMGAHYGKGYTLENKRQALITALSIKETETLND